MIIYLFYIGLVLGFAMDKTAGFGNAIILMGAFMAVFTSATTFVASKWLGSTATLGESIKGNIAALIAVWLSIRFGFQMAHKSPLVFFAAPLLALVSATLVLNHMLSLAWPRALGVVVVSTALVCFGLQVVMPAAVALFFRF